jgi:methylmalonic aciduria homocystinuria type C protein
MADGSQLPARVAARCAAAGLDLVHPFRVAWFNHRAAANERLPDFERADALGVLIGNTRALWPRFLDSWRRDPALRAETDPIECYTARVVTSSLADAPVRWRIRWAHGPAPHRPPMQRLAHHAGLAHLAPCALNVHAIYGPWIALRAVIVFDAPGPDQPPPDLPNPCPDCATACLPAFARAAAALRDDPGAAFGLGDTWRLWLAIRDACPIGRAHRYGDAQIAYHYRNDRRVLVGEEHHPGDTKACASARVRE